MVRTETGDIMPLDIYFAYLDPMPTMQQFRCKGCRRTWGQS